MDYQLPPQFNAVMHERTFGSLDLIKKRRRFEQEARQKEFDKFVKRNGYTPPVRGYAYE